MLVMMNDLYIRLASCLLASQRSTCVDQTIQGCEEN